MKTILELNQIEKLLPHRKPMLLIEKISNIIFMSSATGHMHVKKDSFFF